jgi:2-dehydro-3-deoxyglucarate aldolase/4-hydroxy-2-oxoheptanedioate aldolase
VPGQTTAQVFLDALAQVRDAAHKHGKSCGLLVSDGAAAAAKFAEGWSFSSPSARTPHCSPPQ